MPWATRWRGGGAWWGARGCMRGLCGEGKGGPHTPKGHAHTHHAHAKANSGALPRPLASQPAPTPIPPGMRWRCQCGDNGGGASLTCASARGYARNDSSLSGSFAGQDGFGMCSKEPFPNSLPFGCASWLRPGRAVAPTGMAWTVRTFLLCPARNCVADDMWSLAARLEFGGWRERWWPSQVHTVTHAPPPPRPCPRSSSNPHRHAHLTPHPRPHRHARHAVEIKMQDGRLTVRCRWRWCGGCACESAT